MIKIILLSFVSLNGFAADKLFQNEFIDKDGDKITILDVETRQKLKATKEIAPSHVYDSEEDIEKFKSEFEKNVLSDKNLKYGEYIVIKGDSLKVISQKLYGSTTKWKEIQVINESVLKNDIIRTGMKLKYIIYPEATANDGQNRENSNKKD
jgi:nucleoid-associated protein YgaU